MIREPNNFISIEPKIPELRKHIAYYYFHSNNDLSNSIEFIYYPHINHAITAYQSSSAIITQKCTSVFPKKDEFTTLYSRLQYNPHKVIIKGRFKKIGIVFKPYGINYFITKSLHEISPDTISIFSEWQPNFSAVCENIWKETSLNRKVLLLEEFLIYKMTNNGNPAFKAIIDKIIASGTNQKISALSAEFKLSRKTFYRLFIKELGCSPSDFIKIVKFRKSLDLHLQSNNKTLTETAVANYYDQSDFIKNVKAKTDDTPKNFLKNLSIFNKETYWKFR